MQSNSDENTRTYDVLPNGTMVSHYRIVGKIGAGGMGEVYRAEDVSLKREVAIKFLPDAVAADPVLRERFTREAQATAALKHPNIVTIHEVSEYRGRPFYVMEYVAGNSLDRVIGSDGLELGRALSVSLQIIDALAEAHAAGVVHRDIKPANVVLDKKDRPQLVDFGLARTMQDDRLTKEGTTTGTLSYMSPEQLQGSDVDHRSDLFSFGIVLYEMLTGKHPLRRDNDAATVQAILHQRVPAVSSQNDNLPPELDAVLFRLTEISPDDRYESAENVRDDLKKIRVELVSADASSDTEASIAVLPFENMSTDPEQEYFCDGIAEDIINDLTQIGDICVVARTSAFAFKGKHEDVRKIGRKLGVATVLEGSVRKAGKRVRVTAQLINVSDGYHLWSERYDRDMDDIFAIQDDISKTIVSALRPKLVQKSEAPRIEAPSDPQAYHLYSKGRFFLNQRTLDGFKKAQALFERSVREFPDYALSYVGLADTYFLMFAYGLMTPRDAAARSRDAALRAIDLSPGLAEPYTTLGGLLTYYDWEWDEAVVWFEQALERNPGHATAHQWYGELLSFTGKAEQAEHHLQTALKFDPLSDIVNTMLGAHYMRTDRPREALDCLLQAEELGTDNDTTFAWAGFTLLELGKREEAIKHFDEGCRRSGDAQFPLAMRAHAFALMGDLQPARDVLIRLLEQQKTEWVSPTYIAVLHLDLDESEKAVPWLEQAVRRHDSELIFMAIMPYYRALRANPAAAAVLSVLGLSA